MLKHTVMDVRLQRFARRIVSFALHTYLAWSATLGIAGAATGESGHEATLVPRAVSTASAEPASLSQLLQVAGGLLVVVIVIFALAWLVRRVGMVSGVAGSVLRVLGVVSVGQREKLVLVQVGEKQLLVGVAPGSVTTLHVLETPIDIPAGKLAKATALVTGDSDAAEAQDKLRGSFASRLEAALSQRIKK